MNDEHTPEPWFDYKSTLPKTLNAEDYERACICVNALAGIPNPADWMADAAGEALAVYSLAQTGNPDYIKDIAKITLNTLNRYPYNQRKKVSDE